jgi:hypothetical protein
MSEVVQLESRRKPLRYNVAIESYRNGKVTVFLEGLEETAFNRRMVSEILRHAANVLIEPSPESHS